MPLQAGNGSAPVYVKSYDISGATTGVALATLNPAGVDVFITRAFLNCTTLASGATCTVDLGIGDAADDTADARKDDILDGIDLGSGSATGIYDSMNLDIAGATAICKPIAWVSDDYLLLSVATGDATGVVAKLYIEYTYA